MEIFTIIELIGAALGILGVYLTTRESVWNWPVGIAMVSIYIYVFASAKLYSDMAENFIYIFMQAYGWWYWVRGPKHKRGQKTAPIVWLKWRERIFWGCVIASGSLAVGYAMSHYTDASFPYTDALTTVASLVAQWLVARKAIENWMIWFVVDVISTTIYVLKGLYFTAALFLIFIMLAVKGFFSWYYSPNQARRKARRA